MQPFHPEIGGNVHGSLFENFTPLSEVELQVAIEGTLNRWEPRVVVEEVKVNDSEGYSLDQNKLGITISFSIANVPNVIHDVEVFLDKVR